ncbi:SET and MYND domain-containing [Hyphodiscus hymeniophilus]|uniref:SET and MYND domain-containing n=1 Tax=Hyphodiscus hymeniophilus TaxID=353542 RepID=A0A9P6VN06_9HELO|nr:SET and MYND domain-containing [Hyphodiscus hymeniophilus]
MAFSSTSEQRKHSITDVRKCVAKSPDLAPLPLHAQTPRLLVECVDSPPLYNLPLIFTTPLPTPYELVMAQTCASCAKAEPATSLTRCAKFHTTFYCSRDCQKADWKAHKKSYALNAANNASTPDNESTPTRRAVQIERPFHRLNSKTWLHDRPEEDVYKLLIDSYRLRLEDDYTFEDDAAEDSIYAGEDDSRVGFHKFLRRAEEKRGLLPPWWSKAKADACVMSGFRVEAGNVRASLACAVEKSDVVEGYGSPLMPMQMQVENREVAGTNVDASRF